MATSGASAGACVRYWQNPPQARNGFHGPGHRLGLLTEVVHDKPLFR